MSKETLKENSLNAELASKNLTFAFKYPIIHDIGDAIASTRFAL